MTDENTKYLIYSLEKKHDRSQFSCGNDALDQYLKIQAGQDIKKNVAVTYVLTNNHSTEVLGYYTLSSLGIFPGELPNELIQKLPRYPVLPGILIGRLAVNKNLHGKNLGSYLLIDALKRCISVSNQIGVVAVVVDAKNEKAVKFYKHFGFVHLPENSHRLFLPLGTIRKLNL